MSLPFVLVVYRNSGTIKLHVGVNEDEVVVAVVVYTGAW
jgi:hypothetical protein